MGNESRQTAEFLRIQDALDWEDAERRQIAREVHGELVQNAAALIMYLDTEAQAISSGGGGGGGAGRSETIRQMALDLANSASRISRRLYPSALEHIGLEGALRELVERHPLSSLTVENRAGTNGRGRCRLAAAEKEWFLYRVAELTMAEACLQKHLTTVHLSIEATRLSLAIAAGEDAPRIQALLSQHKWLPSLALRGELLRGGLTLHSNDEESNGSGPFIRAWIPREK